jgi:hypothetical protein
MPRLVASSLHTSCTTFFTCQYGTREPKKRERSLVSSRPRALKGSRGNMLAQVLVLEAQVQ